MIIYDYLEILHETLFLLNILLKVWCFGKGVSIRGRKDQLILVVTPLQVETIYRSVGDFCFCFPGYLRLGREFIYVACFILIYLSSK